MTSEQQYLADIIGIGIGVDRMQLTVDLPGALKVSVFAASRCDTRPLLLFRILCCVALRCVALHCDDTVDNFMYFHNFLCRLMNKFVYMFPFFIFTSIVYVFVFPVLHGNV